MDSAAAKPAASGKCGRREAANLRTEKDADVKPFTSSGDPTVIAAPPPRSLLIGEEDRAMRCAAAGGDDGVGIGGSGDAGKVQLAGEESVSKFSVEGSEVEHWVSRVVRSGAENRAIPGLKSETWGTQRWDHCCDQSPAPSKIRAVRGLLCPGSAAMVIEMLTARADWVSAPTLTKSTPVSA